MRGMQRLRRSLGSFAFRHLATLLACTLAIAGGATVAFVDEDGDDRPDGVVLVVNRAPDDGAPQRTLTVPAAAVAAARPLVERDLQTVPAPTPADLRAAAQRAAARIRATEAPLPTVGASQGFAGCRTRFVANQSSRGGVRPQVQVLHYTVSPNRPGWSDVDAIAALFNTPSFQASANFVIDGEGNCAYLVPIEAKAWTQAGGNPFAVSYEIIATGREPAYLAPAGLARLRLVMREVARRTGIPLRRGAVAGCTPTRSGIVQHADGGLCWGGHGDIAPFALQPIVDYVAGTGTAASRATAIRRRILRGLAAPRGSGHSRRFWCARAAAQHVTLTHAFREACR